MQIGPSVYCTCIPLLPFVLNIWVIWAETQVIIILP